MFQDKPSKVYLLIWLVDTNHLNPRCVQILPHMHLNAHVLVQGGAISQGVAYK